MPETTTIIGRLGIVLFGKTTVPPAVGIKEADPPRCHCCGELYPRGPCANLGGGN